MCRGKRVHSDAGGDEGRCTGERNGEYKEEKSKVEMPCFFCFLVFLRIKHIEVRKNHI